MIGVGEITYSVRQQNNRSIITDRQIKNKSRVVIILFLLHYFVYLGSVWSMIEAILNLPNDDELWDKAWDDLEKLTKRTPAKDAKIEIQNMMRLVLPIGEEYIVHDRTDI